MYVMYESQFVSGGCDMRVTALQVDTPYKKEHEGNDTDDDDKPGGADKGDDTDKDKAQ